MTSGQSAQNTYDQVVQAYGALQSSIAVIAQVEREQAGENGFVARVDFGDITREIKRNAFRSLLKIARSRFSPPAASLKIDEAEVIRSLLPQNSRYHDAADIDLVTAWEWLEKTYGGDCGVTIANSQVAATLIDSFSIKSGMTPRLVGGKMVLDLRVWLDDFDKKHNGKCHLSYNCRGRLERTIAALASFAGWAGEGETELAVGNFVSHYNSQREVQSREKIELGKLELVTLHNRFEFRFGSDLANLFMEYVSLFGTLEAETA